MQAVGPAEFLLLLISLLGTPPVGITLPNQPEPDPAADAARFQAVTGQLDQGGVVHAYLSVDGDLAAIAGFVKSFMDDMRPLASDVPHVNIPALLRVTGLDAVSAMGFSSVRTEDGFRNKTYLHTPKGRKGLLLLFGEKPKPFESLKLAPAGADFVFEQDLNLKTLYDSMVEAATIQMSEEGKTLVQTAFKLPPPTPFNMEKLMADLNTRVTVIIDADPTKMVEIPQGNGLKMSQLSGAALIDGLGWIAEELAKVFEPKSAQGPTRKSPFKIIRNANWVGMQLALVSEHEKKAFAELGWDKAILAHHLPSGKLILASDKEFADKLFAAKPDLGQDPEFLKTMKDLPVEGTALTYASPALFSSLRNFFETVIGKMEGDHNKDDRFAAATLLNLVLPRNARGEGLVTTETQQGMLTVSNSAHSHKTSLVSGLASPVFMIAGVATNQALEARERALRSFEEADDEVPSTEELIRRAEEVIRTEEEDLEKSGE